MASVLCTGVDESLLTTRKLILEKAGHNVVPVADERELLAACSQQNFDVAVIGQTVSVKQKHRILTLVRQHCPKAKILELFSPATGRILSQADDWLEVPANIPADLAERVGTLASSTQRRSE